MPALRPGDPTKLGNWTLTRRIAEGGAGNIFQGVRGFDDSENAAIKVLKDEAFDVLATQEYLKREVAALKLVDHENVAKLIEANFESGEMWLATEYVYGPNLETFLKQNPEGINEHRWFQIAENIFSGLVAVHSHNIIHRDIKPSNIMLSEQTRAAKIIDFGISYVPSFTAFSAREQFEGSRLFAAPENISLKDDPKMDVFSAAVTLAYLGKGSSIWRSETPSQLTESIIKGAPNLDGLTKNQQEFLKPLLAKLPSERSSSSEAHGKCLEYLQFLVGKTKQPRKNRVLQIKRKLRNRNSKIVAFGFTSLILVIVIAFSLTQMNSTPSNLHTVISTPSPGVSSQASSTPTLSKTTDVQDAADCLNLTAKSPQSALTSCLKSSETGNAVSTYQAAYIYNAILQDNKNATIYANKAIKLGYADAYAILGGIQSDKKNYQAAIELLMKGEKLGAHGTAVVLGNVYHATKNRPLEIKYFVEAAGFGDVIGMYDAGNAYYDDGNLAMAQKYYELAARKGDAPSMWALATVYQNDLKNTTQACVWYKKASDAGLASAQRDYKNYCSTSNLQDSEKIVPRLSYPTSADAVQSFIFGKPWLNNSMEWQIEAADPGQNPPIGLNELQVMDQNNLSTQWVSIPYKLVSNKVGSSFEVDAVVSKIYLDLFTKQTNFCPKFRFVKEVNSKVVQIWSKSDTTCEFAYASPSPSASN